MKYIFPILITFTIIFASLMSPIEVRAQENSLAWDYFTNVAPIGVFGSYAWNTGAGKLADLADNSLAATINFLFALVLGLLSIFLSLANFFFVEVVNYTVINFSQNIAELGVIENSWTIVRNIANIFFIFILLYLAISTVLQLSGVDTRKMLVNIIIIALLINFSAVFTKVAIDASNVTAVTFYNLMVPPGEDGARIATFYRSALSIFQGYNLSEVLNEADDGPMQSFGTAVVTSSTLQVIAKNVGMLILLVISIFTLLAASLLLMIRGLSIIILIIISPLAFLGYAFGPLKEVFNLWLSRLRCDVLFAPLFMFLLYLTFTLLQGFYGNTEGLRNEPFMKHLIIFFILNGLMLSSIIIAQKVGCEIGNKSFNFVTKRSKQALGGIAGVTGRNTIGRGAKAIQKSDWLKNKAANNPRLGWVAGAAAEKVAGYGFGSKLGFEGRTDQRQKRQADQLKNLKNPNLKAKYLSQLDKEDAKKQYGDMSDREKADIEIEAINEGNTEMVNVMRGLREDLKGEKKENANKEYEKQLQKYLKRATKDYTDASGNEVKKGDQLTIAQQLEKLEAIGQTFVKDKANPTTKEQEAGRKLQQETYNALSDADKVAIKKGVDTTLKSMQTKDDTIQNDPSKTTEEKSESAKIRQEAESRLPKTESRLEDLEKDYLKGQGETEQKFREEEEKLKKQNQKRALEESKRLSKEAINNIFKNIPDNKKSAHTLSTSEINELKKSIGKLNAGDIANLDNTILQNQFVIERLSRQALTKIIANTEHIETNTLKIIQDYVTNPANLNNLDDKTAPKAFD